MLCFADLDASGCLIVDDGDPPRGAVVLTHLESIDAEADWEEVVVVGVDQDRVAACWGQNWNFIGCDRQGYDLMPLTLCLIC